MKKSTSILFSRYLKREFREPMWVFMSLIEPILYILLYLPILKRVNNNILTPDEVMVKFIPGILTLITMGGFFSGFGFIDEMRRGIIDKFLLSPINKSSVIIAILLSGFIVGSIQVSLAIFAGILQGLKISLTSFLLIQVLMTITYVITGSFSHAISVKLKDEGALAGMTRMLYLPLMLMSGIMLPISIAPKWMQNLALFNPFYHIVEAGREIFLENFLSTITIRGFIVALIFALISFVFAMKSIEKEVA